jgi:hypothetical protein
MRADVSHLFARGEILTAAPFNSNVKRANTPITGCNRGVLPAALDGAQPRGEWQQRALPLLQNEISVRKYRIVL